jgi:hypothetical protein
MDLFVVPTVGFNLLYALVIVRLERRDLVHGEFVNYAAIGIWNRPRQWYRQA